MPGHETGMRWRRISPPSSTKPADEHSSAGPSTSPSFDDALTANSTRRVLFVHGPGGIGKTALLHQFGLRARAGGRTPITIDGRAVDCSPDGLRSALDRAAARAVIRVGGEEPARVLLLDGYERLGPIDDWVRDELLPSLDADAVVVLAGRDSPPAPWRTDPGWRALAAVHGLRALSEAESVDLLARADVPHGLRPISPTSAKVIR
jgi:hypothetical protein